MATPARDRISSAIFKLERAKEHIADFDSRRVLHRDRRPYHAVFEKNPQGDGWRWICRERESIPKQWSAIVADAIHNLHVALDHGWKFAVAGNREIRNEFFPAPEAAKTRFKGKEHGRLKTAVEIVRRMNGFEVGGAFHLICDFDNADKHDTMRFVACCLSDWSWSVPYETVHGQRIVSRQIPDGVFVLKDGAELPAPIFSPAVRQGEQDLDTSIAFDIAFDEGGPLWGKSVYVELTRFCGEVQSLLDAFSYLDH